MATRACNPGPWLILGVLFVAGGCASRCEADEIPFDGIDNDCDDLTPDDDGDADGVSVDEDCDDSNPEVRPGALEVPYDGIDNDCNPDTVDDDLDRDGVNRDEDCDDDNPDVAPGLDEVPFDGLDNDCDPSTSDDDLDGDGVPRDEDCDDSNPDLSNEVGTIDGDVSPQTHPDLCDEFCFLSVTGGVTVAGTDAQDLDWLRCVTSIERDLFVQNNDQLLSLEGADLVERIGGALILRENASLRQTTALADAIVETSVVVTDNPSLEWLAVAPDAEAFTEYLVLDNPALVTVQPMPGLRSVDVLWLLRNPALVSDNFVASIEQVGDFQLEGEGFVDLSFPNLTAADDILLEETGLSGARFPVLTTATSITVRDSPNLEVFSTPLMTAPSVVELARLPQLDGVDTLSGITSVDSLRLEGLSTSVNLPTFDALTQAQTIELVDLSIATLSGFDQLASVQTLTLRGLSSLTEIDGFGSLSTVGALEVTDTLLPDLSAFGGLTSIDQSVRVEDNAALTNLRGLEAASGPLTDVNIKDNDGLTSLDGLESLREVTALLEVQFNPLLTSVTALEGLQSVQALVITNNVSLGNATAQALVDSVGAGAFGLVIIDANESP